MIIPTLGTGQLYLMHRDRQRMKNATERKRAIILLCGITALVTFTAYILIIYWPPWK